MKKKMVYVLFIENSWVNEEYSDVIDVFNNEQDAQRALQQEKTEFFSALDKEDYPDLDITDNTNHFQCLDENMGNNFELWVFEKELK